MALPSSWGPPPMTPSRVRPRKGEKKAVVTDGWVDNLLRMTILVMILTLVVLMAGCCPYSDHVSVKAIAPAVKKVVQRHDKYVSQDPALMDIERRLQLSTSRELNGVVDEALGNE